MGKSMLDYTKTILQKMSFDASLLQKEWGKAINWLMDSEVMELEKWVHDKLGVHLKPIPAVS